MITYNHEPYIRQAVQSVLEQRFRSLELIIADDASTDATPKILADLASGAPNKIRTVLRERNVGMQGNLEDAWSRATGRYIALLEGDDYWTDAGKLANQVRWMNDHPECSLSFHRVQTVDQSGLPVGDPWPTDRSMGAVTLEELTESNFIPTCSVLFRGGCVVEFPSWIRSLRMADWPLHLLHAARGEVHFLDAVAGAYRLHPGGVFSTLQLSDALMAEAECLGAAAASGEFPERIQHLLKHNSSIRFHWAASALDRSGFRSRARVAYRRSLSYRPMDTSRMISRVRTLVRLYTPMRSAR